MRPLAQALVIGGVFIGNAQAMNFSDLSKWAQGRYPLPAQGVELPTLFKDQLKALGFELSPSKILTAHGVSTKKFQVTRDGIEVLGAVAMTHTGLQSLKNNVFTNPEDLTDQTAIPSFNLSTRPYISVTEASEIALGLIGDRTIEVLPELKILPSEKEDGSAKLIYWVNISATEQEPGRDLLLDANQGSLLADLSHHLEIAPTLTLMATDQCQVLDQNSGYPVSVDLESCPVAVRSGIKKPIADETAIRADNNSQAVLHYYWVNHARDSFNDQGSTATSVVHIGKSFANAFWSSDKDFMAYGDGDGVVMTDLTRSLDVAGHEMTHGVTAHSSQLIYQSESGALNEAFSDFFGIAIAAQSHSSTPDWAIGKEIFLNDRKNIGLRNLQNPGSILARYRDDNGKLQTKPYPGHVRDQFTTANPCSGQNDRCFVHINSMIPGHAMYLISEAIGLDRAEALLYVTLTQYLTKTSTFKNFKTQTIKACRQLYERSECSQVRSAFQEVGL